MKNKKLSSPLLSVSNLYFQLPEGFEGTTDDAISTFDATDPAQVAAAYHRERAAREAAEAENAALRETLRKIACMEHQDTCSSVLVECLDCDCHVVEAIRALLAQANGEVTP